MLYSNVAGRETQLLDRNLSSNVTPEAITTIVVGTAERGPTNRSFIVTDQSQARAVYGDAGTLIQGMYETIAAGAPLVKLYRIGGTVAELGPVASALTIKTVEAGEGIEEEYALSWIVDAGGESAVLKGWRINENTTRTLVYEWDTSSPLPTIDLGEISVVKDGVIDYTEADFGTSTLGEPMNELDVTVSGGLYPLIAGASGIAPTRQKLYELLYEAYYNLFNDIFDFIVPMDVYLDDYNIADISSTTIDAWELANGKDISVAADLEDFLEDTFGTTDALLYATVTQDDEGVFTFTWSGVSTDSNHEVNFGYQLANFCHQMTRNEIMCHGTIGVLPPGSFTDQGSVNKWVGKLPTYSDESPDEIITDGSGLLGNKFMSGTVSNQTGGFWATDSEWLDDPSIMVDRNGNDIDIGRHISVFPDWLYVVNSYAAIINPTTYSYIATGAPSYCGFLSSLDQKEAPTNKPLPGGGRVPYKVALAKIDNLVFARYVVMRPRPDGYRVARGSTAARWTSDFKEFSTFNIIKRVDDEVRKVITKYIGRAFDTYMKESMQTDLNQVGKAMRSAGYIKGQYEFRPIATPIQAANGQLILFSTVTPAFELIRVTNITSISL